MRRRIDLKDSSNDIHHDENVTIDQPLHVIRDIDTSRISLIDIYNNDKIELIPPWIIRPFLYCYYQFSHCIYIPVPYFVDKHHHYEEESVLIQQNNNDKNKFGTLVKPNNNNNINGAQQSQISSIRRCYHYDNNNYYYRYSIDCTFTLLWFIIFIIIDYSVFILIRYCYNTASLPIPINKELRMISGSITTIIHSTILIILLSTCFYYNQVTIIINENGQVNSSSTSLKKKNDDFDVTQPASTATTKDSSTTTLTGIRSYIPSMPMYCHITPIWWKDCTDGILQFCIGYMIYDIIIQFGIDKIYFHNNIWKGTDYIFIGHHIVTSAYMISTRILYSGHISAMILMYFGEITAPIMNLLRISFTCKSYMLLSSTTYIALDQYYSIHYLTNIIHSYLEYIYAILYFTIRAIIGPCIVIHLTYHFLLTKRGRINVPIYISILWLILSWGVILGSYNWIKNCYHIIQQTGRSGTLE